jgi:hypothetical protein
MATTGPDSNPIEYEKWARFLAREPWYKGNSIECYILLASAIDTLREDDELPHISVIETAAKRSAGFQKNDWSKIDVHAVSQSERAVLGMAALGEALETGSNDALAFAESVSTDLSEMWRAVLVNATTFLRISFGHFPHDAFASSGVTHNLKVEREFKILQAVLDHNSQKQFGLKSGRAIWLHLFGPEGKFSKLLEAVRRHDLTVVHEWFDTLETFGK